MQWTVFGGVQRGFLRRFTFGSANWDTLGVQFLYATDCNVARRNQRQSVPIVEIERKRKISEDCETTMKAMKKECKIPSLLVFRIHDEDPDGFFIFHMTGKQMSVFTYFSPDETSSLDVNLRFTSSIRCIAYPASPNVLACNKHALTSAGGIPVCLALSMSTCCPGKNAPSIFPRA